MAMMTNLQEKLIKLGYKQQWGSFIKIVNGIKIKIDTNIETNEITSSWVLKNIPSKLGQQHLQLLENVKNAIKIKQHDLEVIKNA